MVSEDNTVTNENIASTTGTIAIETEAIETETQDAIQPSSDQPPEATPEYKIIMVGDVLLHTPVEESCLQPDGSYDYDSLFSNTKEEIAAADLALVNQEVIIGGADLGISGYPCFNADYSLCDSLVGAGFDVICHATNHAMDKGRAGLVNCAEYWRDEYPQITVLGIHDTADTSTSCGADPSIIELGDMRIAVLNYTYGTNGISLPADMPYAVDLLNEEQVAADIQRAKEKANIKLIDYSTFFAGKTVYEILQSVVHGYIQMNHQEKMLNFYKMSKIVVIFIFIKKYKKKGAISKIKLWKN